MNNLCLTSLLVASLSDIASKVGRPPSLIGMIGMIHVEKLANTCTEQVSATTGNMLSLSNSVSSSKTTTNIPTTTTHFPTTTHMLTTTLHMPTATTTHIPTMTTHIPSTTHIPTTLLSAPHIPTTRSSSATTPVPSTPPSTTTTESSTTSTIPAFLTASLTPPTFQVAGGGLATSNLWYKLLARDVVFEFQGDILEAAHVTSVLRCSVNCNYNPLCEAFSFDGSLCTLGLNGTTVPKIGTIFYALTP